jgi:hypothetical protein
MGIYHLTNSQSCFRHSTFDLRLELIALTRNPQSLNLAKLMITSLLAGNECVKPFSDNFEQ